MHRLFSLVKFKPDSVRRQLVLWPEKPTRSSPWLRPSWPRVAAFDRRRHGRTADTSEAFHYESMVDETIEVIEHFGGRRWMVRFLGCCRMDSYLSTILV